MQGNPLVDQTARSEWERTFNYFRSENFYKSLMLSVYSMKVRRWMIDPEHSDAQKVIRRIALVLVVAALAGNRPGDTRSCRSARSPPTASSRRGGRRCRSRSRTNHGRARRHRRPNCRARCSRRSARGRACPPRRYSASFVGFTTAEPAGGDTQVTIGFQSRPELDRVLGSTSIHTDDATGAILEADIFL